MGKRNATVTGTVGSFVEDALSQLEELAGEMREWADTLEENFSHTEKYTLVEQAAGELEAIEEFDVTEDFADMVVQAVQDQRVRPSRQRRCDNAVVLLEAALAVVEAVEKTERYCDDQDYRHEYDCLWDSIREAIDTATGVEFPGAFG